VTASPFNEKTIAEFHAKRGRGVGMWGDNALLMTAKGAKSGHAITTPLVFGRDGDDYVVVASKGGAPDNPLWFANVKANPEVEVEVADGDKVEKFKARARVADDPTEHDRLYRGDVEDLALVCRLSEADRARDPGRHPRKREVAELTLR
jgi:deazaflavin-dependent oxidoreductase (nitroreductase family)